MQPTSELGSETKATFKGQMNLGRESSSPGILGSSKFNNNYYVHCIEQGEKVAYSSKNKGKMPLENGKFQEFIVTNTFSDSVCIKY